ncbi:hypothetical protein QD172_17170 [Cobetia sp. 10Alg 146]|uniref:ArnT family glycosyltransferase n=1 Tax=Cobetia sp. 10Alg 146 TaxID=3040019 RepID=UPI00244C85DC|nr:hypothetical protein [Cobetia sp. 10Alg 146]MDH2292966.1 hypothetical protein [Cobetia sp. 10Alg 146]
MKRQAPRSRVIKRSETEPATRAGRWRKAMALAESAVSSGANLCASERLCWALWLTLLMAGALARPYLPIDETRYVSVAWEMWHSGHWFVSSMNGAPYADKPVLLFWLIHAGWAVFGVNEVWPKVLMPLVSLLGIWQLGRVARTLWPVAAGEGDEWQMREQWVSLTRWTLAGCLMWMLYSQALMFDVLLTTCLLGALRPWCSPLGAQPLPWKAVAESGLWLGLALLAKGPVALLWFAVVVGSRPWWTQAKARQVWAGEWRGWGMSLLLGLVVLCVWLLPAVITGPASYVEDLLWGQTAHRVVAAQDHARPLWWYLPWLVVLIFPFSLRPRLLLEGFLASIAQRPTAEQPLLRLGRVWALSGLLIFSLISGKQVHYLMPLLVPLSLLLAWAALRQPPAHGALRLLAMTSGGLGVASLALAVIVMPSLAPTGLARWSADSALVASSSTSLSSFLAGAGLLALMSGLWPSSATSGAISARQVSGVQTRHDGVLIAQRRLVLGSVLLVTCLLSLTLRPLWPRLDQTAIAQWINGRQQAGQQVAVVGWDYQATWQFTGRLTRPLETLTRDAGSLSAWQAAHPDGWLVIEAEKCLRLPGTQGPLAGMRDWCQAAADGKADTSRIFHQGRHRVMTIPAAALGGLPSASSKRDMSAQERQ